jgi:MFS family permease
MEQREQLWNRNYCKVMVANFTLFFAFYILTPLLPLYLSEHFGATKDVIGLVLSGYTITALLFRPFSGYVVDAFPRKTVLMISFGAFAIFFAGYLAASTLLLFTIVRTLHGGPFGALTVSNSTVAIDVLPSSRRTEGIGYYGLSNNLAMAVAPSIGIFIYQLTHSFDFLFWLAFIVACLGWIVDSTVGLERKEERGKWKENTPAADSKDKSNLIPLSSFHFPLSWDRFFLVRGWLLGVNMVAFGFSFGVLSNYLAIYGKEVMGITGGTGTYFMLCSVGLILSRLQGGKALRNGRVTHNAGSGMVISLIGYTLFILMPTLTKWSMFNVQWSMILGYYGSALLIGLGNGHMWPAFQNMTINVARNNQRGTANSTILISWDIGMGLGILIGGVVSELLGYSAAFWTVVLVNASGVACFFLATKAFFLRRNLNESVR